MQARSFIFGSFGALLLLAGCPGPSDATDAGTPTRPDLGSGVDLGCYVNPKTHVEIINACTDTQAIDKAVNLPLLRPDGTLPPLP